MVAIQSPVNPVGTEEGVMIGAVQDSPGIVILEFIVKFCSYVVGLLFRRRLWFLKEFVAVIY